MTTVLVVGGGAREHALAWRLLQDGAEVHCAPGNAGMAQEATVHPVAADDIEGLVALAKSLRCGLVVVGPEAPLVLGLVDALEAEGIAAFGPRKAAARLEGSKVFAKELMDRQGVPTAGWRAFDNADAAEAYIRQAKRPLVVKADGLAAGKGVVVAKDTEEALAAVAHIMRERAFGEAGDRVLIEECLVGEEVSYHVVSDGERYVALASAQDHKRAFEGDKGPNTGGMGAYSPPPVVTEAIEAAILEQVIEPTLSGMAELGTPFRGALFVGLMIVDGQPVVLEYNVRFGDPETEVLMMRWGGKVLPLLTGSAEGNLAGIRTQWTAPAALCVVLASGGYPRSYEKGKVIEGLGGATADCQVFHAGTRTQGQDTVTAGGRVLAVTAFGDSLAQAAERAYAVAEGIDFEGKMLRRDIGWRALKE